MQLNILKLQNNNNLNLKLKCGYKNYKNSVEDFFKAKWLEKWPFYVWI